MKRIHLPFQEFVDRIEAVHDDTADLLYSMDDDPVTELLQTGSVTVAIYGKTYEIALEIAEVIE